MSVHIPLFLSCLMRVKQRQRLRCQYLYPCTSKASKPVYITLLVSSSRIISNGAI